MWHEDVAQVHRIYITIGIYIQIWNTFKSKKKKRNDKSPDFVKLMPMIFKFTDLSFYFTSGEVMCSL